LKMDERVVADELRSVRSICGAWLKAVDTAMKDKSEEVDGDQMRRELSLCAAKLEAIVSAEG